MPNKSFNVKQHRRKFKDLLEPIDLESALLYCNHVLAAARGDESETIFRVLADGLPPASVQFLVHLAARQVLLHSLGPRNSPMHPEAFKQLIRFVWEQWDHDPAFQDPGWTTCDPTGWFIRYTGLQQRLIKIHTQNYGLAVALFTGDLARQSDEPIDIPQRMRDILRMPVEVFMRTGFVASAIRIANIGRFMARGTVSTDLITTRPLEVGAGVTQHWPRFLELTSCSLGEFKKRTREHASASIDERYDLYKFNLLKSFPLIDIGGARFVAPDPELVNARTTLGIYYDALNADGKCFTDAFGYRVANLVGDLTASACGKDRVWSESTLDPSVRSNPPSKNADHAIRGGNAHVLIECKALRPNSQLLMLGDPEDADKLIKRVACAVVQLSEHAVSIRNGQWTQHGLSIKPCFGILVTYGDIPIVNAEFFAEKVIRCVHEKTTDVIPYMVFSLSDFDSFLRLVELGHLPEAIMQRLVGNCNAGFPGPFLDALSDVAVSSTTRRRGKAFLDTLPSEPETQ